MLTRVGHQIRKLNQVQMRTFAGGHGPAVDPTPPTLDATFNTTSKEETKFMVLNGLMSTTPLRVKWSNPYAHLNDKPLYHYEHTVSGYEGGHSVHHDHGLYDEPYGYEFGDDPFETTGKMDYPLLLIFFAMVIFVNCTVWIFRFDKINAGHMLYHQKLVADELESKIRELRRE